VIGLNYLFKLKQNQESAANFNVLKT